jgi:hypothetical protein
MPAIDPHEIQRWERRETEPSRLRRIIGGIRHNFLPAFFRFTVSAPRLTLGGVRLLGLLLLALWPIWMKAVEQTASFSWGQAFWLSVIVVVFLIYNHVYDRVASSYKSKAVKKAFAGALGNDC